MNSNRTSIPSIGGRYTQSKHLTVGAIQDFQTRAAAHADATPRPDQEWQNLVTDLEVARVMYAIEADHIEFYRSSTRTTRWLAPAGLRGYGLRINMIIPEMIRTGLLRHVIEYGVDYLVPALVHLRDGRQSACRFTGEDLGPMRARLVDDLSLVDCLECEATVVRGHARGL